MREKQIYLLLIFFLVTIFSGSVYLTGQQIIRQNADDPQVQIANNVVASLKAGADPSQLSPTQLDIKSSPDPFVVIYDKNGKGIASSGQLDKKIPVPPKGAFDKAAKYGENRFSWTPAKNVRHAAVIVPYDKGFVLAAKSLRETQKRTLAIARTTAIAWVLAIAAITFAFLLSRPKISSEVSEKPVRKSPTRSSRRTKK